LGTCLPEEELSKTINISRLEKEGFVTVTPRKGVAVSKNATQITEDIFEIRETLENLAVKNLSTWHTF